MRRLFTPSNLRLAVQGGFAAFLAFVCVRFVAHVAWALGETEVFTPKPPAVEGFLPISALITAKRLFFTGKWDPVHPAGLTIFLALLLMSWLWRKGFCGQLCPIGFVSNLLERIGRKLGLVWQPGKITRRAMAAPKYLLLGAFAWVSLGMNLADTENFLRAPFNLVADTKMLAFFQSPSALTLAVLGGLAVLSVVIPAFWCRALCPYGALMGLMGWLSPTSIARDENACVSCGRCAKACPMGLPVDKDKRVASPECQGCLECVAACPVQGCLGVSFLGRRIPWWAVALGCLAVLVISAEAADALGLWRSQVPADMIRRMHRLMFGGMPEF